MPFDLTNTLVVGISTTALFDMSESDQIFRDALKNDPDQAIELFRSYMRKHEDIPLEPGTGFPLVSALLGLNKYKLPDESPLVEVVVMSKNSPDTGLRVLNSIRQHKLDITRSAFTAGESAADYVDAFGVDLFLTTDANDAQKVIDSRHCAAAILKAPPRDSAPIPEGQILPPNVTLSWFLLIDDGTAKLHQRLFFTEKGGVIFDRGFIVPNPREQRQVPTSLRTMTKSQIDSANRDYNNTQPFLDCVLRLSSIGNGFVG